MPCFGVNPAWKVPPDVWDGRGSEQSQTGVVSSSGGRAKLVEQSQTGVVSSFEKRPLSELAVLDPTYTEAYSAGCVKV
jgi:hypothetical protein